MRKIWSRYGVVMLAAATVALAVGIFLFRQLRKPVPAEIRPETVSVVLDLNHATATELETLPAVGEKLAARIVEYRGAHGPFASVEDVTDVPGVGPGILDRIAPYVTVTD